MATTLPDTQVMYSRTTVHAPKRFDHVDPTGHCPQGRRRTDASNSRTDRSRPMRPAPILVTGSTGKIGSELVRVLADAGQPVRAMTRHPEREKWMQDLGIDVVQGDFLQPETLTAAVEGVKRAFLLSPNVREMKEMQSNFVRAAEKADVDHVVKLSAAGADADSSWDIARWHGEIESGIETAALDHTFIRPVSYMQNLLEDAATIRADGVFARATPPDARINVVDTRDVARVAAKALLDSGHRGKTYKPTGPEPITFAQMASTISEVTGRSVEFRELDPATARASLLEDGAPEWLADAMVGLQVAFGKGIADLNNNDVSRVTGNHPKSFARFVRDHAERFVSEDSGSATRE
jgi:uncharacterized protein YbjT (DUF2867 family)